MAETIHLTVQSNTPVGLTTEQARVIHAVSPTATVERITGGAEVTVTDYEGTTTAVIYDGAKGDPGQPGQPGAPGQPGQDGVSPTASVTQTATGATVTITDASGTTTATLTNGAPGVSPTVTITEITGGHRITITDATGSHSADVMDGEGGVTDVQVNGTSVVTSGVANVPIADNALGAVMVGSNSYGLAITSAGRIQTNCASANDIKLGGNSYKPIVPGNQKNSTFYGLAKAAGDSTQRESSNAVGTYTETAKSKISDMLNAPVSVSGSTPSITAMAGVRYVCGEVSTLDITLPASGCVDVVFESGSTPTVLTVTPPAGVTVKWANGFDPTSLDASTTYEINIADGLGVAGSWK